jgi:hypothetical protein
MIYARAPPSHGINPTLNEKLDEILAGIEAIEKRLNSIEKRLKWLELALPSQQATSKH